MTDSVSIATRAFNTPLLLDPSKAAIIAQQLGGRFLGLGDGVRVTLEGDFNAPTEAHSRERPKAASLLGDELFQNVKRRGTGYSVVQGVAVIPIVGTLVRRGSHVGASSGVTSYEGISAQIRAAREDDSVRVVALEIDSFGGEAAGIFDLAAQIRDLRKEKPVYAFIADYALSAGYAIASQADHITIPPYGEAGSIGVVVLHVDIQGMLEKTGQRVTLIHSGAKKVEGNPFEKLPDGVRADIQKSNDEMWTGFAELVSLGRKGKVSITDALATEAAVYRGKDAVAAGLADQVSEARTAFAALVAQLNPNIDPGTELVSAGPGAIKLDLSVLANSFMDDVFARMGAISSASIEIGGSRENGAGAALSTQETDMSKDVKKPAATSQVDETADAPVNGAEANASVQADAVKAERERASKITAKVATAGLPASFAQKLIDNDVPLADAYEQILDAKAENTNDGGDIRSSGKVTSDGRDRAKTGMTKALLLKAGLEGGERNEFTGMQLREMARASLMSQGIAVPSGGALLMVGAAFAPAAASGGMHATSDFTNILADIAHKSMLRGFTEAPENFQKFTSVGHMGDFKPHSRVGLGAFPSLSKVEEGGEFKYGTMGDHGETAVLATYGRLFAITRQGIINDDLDMLSKIPANMGRAARRTVAQLVYAVLNSNPAMSDGNGLFHADHKNLADTGGVPSEATINAAITAMATQTDRTDADVKLNIPPKYLLANPTQRSAVLQALNSEHAPDDTSKAGSVKQSRAYNTVRDAAEPIFDARIAGNAWYLAADPNVYDTIEVGYLDGVDTPWLDQQDGWGVDGTEFKVRIDACATALAFEGLYKNPGQ